MLKAMLIVTALAGGGDYTTEMSSMKECLDARETIAKQDPNVKTLCVPISNDSAKVQEILDSFMKMIEKIKQSTHSQISLIILNQTKITKTDTSSKIKNNRDYFLYKIYTKLENKTYHPDIDGFQIKNTAELLGNIEKISVMPELTKYSDWINDDDVNTIHKYDLDVIIRLGFRILKGGILNSAKCGIWSFHHADNNVNRGGPAGFWEVFQQEPTTGSILQILNEDLDGGQIIAKSYSTTDPTFVKSCLLYTSDAADE